MKHFRVNTRHFHFAIFNSKFSGEIVTTFTKCLLSNHPSIQFLSGVANEDSSEIVIYAKYLVNPT